MGQSEPAVVSLGPELVLVFLELESLLALVYLGPTAVVSVIVLEYVTV